MTASRSSLGRSVLAIVVGFVVIGALTVGGDMVVTRMMPGQFDPDGRVDNTAVLLLMTAYVGVFATFGCWLAGRMAPNRPMRHALILGALGLVFNVAGMATNWGLAPKWYFLLNLALVLPYAYLGGLLAERGRAGRLTSAAEVAP